LLQTRIEKEGCAMCGRYTITLEPADFEVELGISDFPPDFAPRYNVAPTQQVVAVRDSESKKLNG